MNPINVQLDAVEREELVRLLTTALDDKRVEVHRTKTLSFQEELAKEEKVIRHLLEKVK